MEASWAALVPELSCSDLDVSMHFWTGVLGFSCRFRREEDRFAYLELGDAQVMLEERHQSSWETALLERPFGRGINLQIEVDDVERLHARVTEAGLPLFRDLLRTEYREDDTVHVAYEFLVQDPDGYLLRFVQNPDAT
ncbi:bleomycin resistance protein [Ilumatobacter fluminis]|uniref:bleomycin resistance protein n=1 Tax=Ilumatobacter fluminis TaxID=467091 RepID=UPI001AAE86FF|nr:VOC family protein [Ilumatobacter fluminis]